ncbi:nucleotide cyclase [Baffinella frigidus]|nr:nucleotide cyclase [Cryptophyta sp. CCMP2293]
MRWRRAGRGGENATGMWKKELRRQSFNRIFVALQICCYVTPILEHLWGGLDQFAFSYLLHFFIPMSLIVSIYGVSSVKAQVFTFIVVNIIGEPLSVAHGGFGGYFNARFAYHISAIFLGLVHRRAEEWERRANWLEQHLAYQEFLRTQEILHDLLPSNVVRKMRDNPDATSWCETRLVVVLVLDLCNFTKISQEGTPLQLIGYINSIFSAFDREMKKQAIAHHPHGLFKMDTIGDAYVAAGLLNSPDPAEATERCAAMIRLSQRMLKVLEDHREVSGKDLRCRIGISTGEVYAGVLGRLQPRYHLFGEPMWVAEELEQRGTSGQAQIEDVNPTWGTKEAFPLRMPAAGLALVDHFQLSEHGTSYQLTERGERPLRRNDVLVCESRTFRPADRLAAEISRQTAFPTSADRAAASLERASRPMVALLRPQLGDERAAPWNARRDCTFRLVPPSCFARSGGPPLPYELSSP